MPDLLGGSGEKYATFTSRNRLEESCDARVPGDGPRDLATRTAEGPGFVLVRSEPLERSREVFAPRRDDEPGLALAHDVERPTGVRHRDDRLFGEERLVRDEPVILVHRRVVDAEAARIEIGELYVADPAQKRRPAVDAASAGQLLEAVAVGPVAGDHDLHAGRERGCLDQQVDALRPVEAVYREDEA